MVSSKILHGVIVPDDMCDVCGGEIGAMIGDIYSPTFALDQASGSNAFKMLPITEDIVEILVGVVKHFRWTDFIFIYDDRPGWCSCFYTISYYKFILVLNNSW